MSLFTKAIAATILLFPLALVGCGGSGPKIVEVSGTLTYKGKPVTNASLDFVPDNGRPSWGATDASGRFTLEYDREHKGALVGKHKVSVRMRPSTTAEQEAVMMGKKMPTTKDMAGFFEKYDAVNSKAVVTIEKATGDLKLDWD